MGGLAHYLESAGLATTQISLIRLHTEQIRPPRALWVPFILGRPFGRPLDAEFQLRVLRAALGLLERPVTDVPVLEDFGEEAGGDVALDGLACPVNYAPPSHDGSLRARLHEEVNALRTWFDLGAERTGRSAFGVSGLSIDDPGLEEGPPPPVALPAAPSWAWLSAAVALCWASGRRLARFRP